MGAPLAWPLSCHYQMGQTLAYRQQPPHPRRLRGALSKTMNLDARMRSVWSIQKENITWTFPPPPPINRGASPSHTRHTRARALHFELHSKA
jgi:hypothetical protein